MVCVMGFYPPLLYERNYERIPSCLHKETTHFSNLFLISRVVVYTLGGGLQQPDLLGQQPGGLYWD